MGDRTLIWLGLEIAIALLGVDIGDRILI